MKVQNGMKKNSSLAKFVLGAHPIIDHFIGKLRIREIIGTYVPSDKRMKLDDGKTLGLLIHNILTTPNPLYEMEDWLEPLDAEKLGLQPDETALIQDDRIGRALARFYNSRHKDVFFRLALRAIKVFDLDCGRVHHDTTSVTFVGKYAGWIAQEQLAFGNNKDHRPDLKQLVLGLNVTADGAVPISHRIYDGNQTDDRIHPANHQGLQRLLNRADFIYVADCKLATKENLQKISTWQGRFVSVMPRSWKEDEQFRHRVRQGKIKWKHILSRRNDRKPDSKMDRYYVAEGEHKTSCDYRYQLKQRKKITQRVEGILKAKHCQQLIACEIDATRHYERIYLKKGRPTKKTPYRVTWKQTYSLSFHIDQDAVKKEATTDGVFPLITNLDPKAYPAKKVLEIYKFQPFLEKRHTQLKTYQEIAPIYLKNAERVVAYLHIHVMALMVASLIERQLRSAMRRQKISSLPIYPEDRLCSCPTIFDLVRLFRNVERYEVVAGDERIIFPAELNVIQKKVLDLLEIPVAAYQ